MYNLHHVMLRGKRPTLSLIPPTRFLLPRRFSYRFGIWCFVITVDFPVFNFTQYLGKNMSEKAIEEMWEQTARGCKYN